HYRLPYYQNSRELQNMEFNFIYSRDSCLVRVCPCADSAFEFLVSRRPARDGEGKIRGGLTSGFCYRFLLPKRPNSAYFGRIESERFCHVAAVSPLIRRLCRVESD